MKDWTWPLAAVVIFLILAIVAMFGFAEELELRKQLIGHFDTIVTFVVGAVTGGVVGGTYSFAKFKGIIP